MKALVLQALHQPLSFVPDYPEPEQINNYRIVRLNYAAINRRDIWIQKGQYAHIRVPVILGSDGSGWLDDKPVIINPGFNWGNKESHQGENFSILGMPLNGTFAEQVSVPKNNIYPLPNHLRLKEGAALPLAGVTAWRALFTRGRITPKDRVLITGIGGGVAHLVMKFALAVGAQVSVTSSKDEYLERALKQGCYSVANYKEKDWPNVLKSKVNSFDLIVDSAGGAAYTSLVKLLDFGGRLVSYGGTTGVIPALSPQIIFWKQLNLLGSTMGSPKDFEDMLDFVRKHEIVPEIGDTFPLSQGQTAFEQAELGGHRKIVLEI